MKLPAKPLVAIALLAALSGCAANEKASLANSGAVENGPNADFPMVIGAPFTIEGITYTPTDRLNVDEVGYATIGTEGGLSVSVAHKTLPLPSYAEVTSLITGKTILARVERRGPMRNDQLIELSPGAAIQLEVANGTHPPVRIRRVNPPENERAMLRAGTPAPARMETPKSLLAVLLRKIGAPQTAETVEPATVPVVPAAAIAQDRPRVVVNTATPPAPPRQIVLPVTPPRREPPPARTAQRPANGLVIQVAALSDRKRADAAASQLGGYVETSGRLYRVRVGPFASHAQAEGALAKARTAGYSDARILRVD